MVRSSLDDPSVELPTPTKTIQADCATLQYSKGRTVSRIGWRISSERLIDPADAFVLGPPTRKKRLPSLLLESNGRRVGWAKRQIRIPADQNSGRRLSTDSATCLDRARPTREGRKPNEPVDRCRPAV